MRPLVVAVLCALLAHKLRQGWWWAALPLGVPLAAAYLLGGLAKIRQQGDDVAMSQEAYRNGR